SSSRLASKNISPEKPKPWARSLTVPSGAIAITVLLEKSPVKPPLTRTLPSLSTTCEGAREPALHRAERGTALVVRQDLADERAVDVADQDAAVGREREAAEEVETGREVRQRGGAAAHPHDAPRARAGGVAHQDGTVGKHERVHGERDAARGHHLA